MILITGSAGLIGSELAARLEARGDSIRHFDLSDGEQFDVTRPDLLASAMAGVSGVIHLAAVSRVADAEQDPAYCRLVNTQGTANVIDAATAADVPWIIFASSREVYGQPENLPASERTPINPINVYGESKVSAERHMQAYQDAGGLCATLRLSNVYGNLSDKQARVIPAFARAAAFGGSLRVEGADKQFDFTHVTDVAQAFESVVDRLRDTGSCLPVMNIASGVPVTLARLVELARDNSTDKLIADVTKSADIFVEAYYSDPTLSRQVLQWQATTGIEQGFASLVGLYKSSL